jgi:RNA polymerase sigma factor (sigma-70 family)
MTATDHTANTTDASDGATPPSEGAVGGLSAAAPFAPDDRAAIDTRDRALLRRVRQGGRNPQDARIARDELVLSCQGLIRRVAKRYTGQGLARTDLVQEGNIGILRAIRKFDPDCKTPADCKLPTFRRVAVQYIAIAMRAAVARARSERAGSLRPGDVPDRDPGEPPMELGEDLLLADVILNRLNSMERLVIKARAAGLDGSGIPASWAAIGQRLGIEAKWVEFFHERAMVKIKDMVARREREEDE